jgi:hypothetical protein
VSNRAFKSDVKEETLELIRTHYPDFGPTLVKEKLSLRHNITLSVETLRKWMISSGLWSQRHRSQRIHPIRERREYFGELIQVDGSYHNWFEDRAEKCNLTVFIDDATGIITSLRFQPRECLDGYFTGLEEHITKYGRPRAIYSDRHAIFGGNERIQHAQLIRALKELDIKSILAYSPQAKGRVERVNRTLQDRLIKEMRLRNISSIEEANEYLPEFLKEFNERFSKEPRGQIDTHRPLALGCDLERILSRCEIRTLSKDLSFSFNSTFYQILETSMINRLKHKKIEIRQSKKGIFKVFYQNLELHYVALKEYRKAVDAKEKQVWKERKAWRPDCNHPWKKQAPCSVNRDNPENGIMKKVGNF